MDTYPLGTSTVDEAFILETVRLSPTRPLSRSFWQGGEDKEHTGELTSQDRVLLVLSWPDNVKWSHLDSEFHALQDTLLKWLERQDGMCTLPHIHTAING